MTRRRAPGKRHVVWHGEKAIRFELRRSKRKKKYTSLSIEFDGVKVDAPTWVSYSDVREFVLERADWILSRASEEAADASAKVFVTGKPLPYLGRNARMVVRSGDAPLPEVGFDHWRFHINAPKTLRGRRRYALIRRELIRWYYARATDRLPAIVARWWPVLGRGTKSRIYVDDDPKAWAACDGMGNLRFNWRVMMLKPALIDYLVVHELAHLTHRNHSKDFRDLTVLAMPDARERDSALNEAGRRLPI